MVYGDMLDAENRVIDRGLAVFFPGPHSYTGEDSAEFHCHGSPVVLRELLSALFALGARQARAGEFTQRAFLNGQLDLTQAEAVIDLIDAEPLRTPPCEGSQHEGAVTRPCVVRKTPPGSKYSSTSGLSPRGTSRGQRSSTPQPKARPDSPVPSLQGPCDRSLKSEEP